MFDKYCLLVDENAENVLETRSRLCSYSKYVIILTGRSRLQINV